ncbi:copper chaperone PCu(A)C [Corynebacterium glyciniphilum]|uniref:copper chaperone PCu(A)C n=1 Tax=Corynebacterium glyciniphilum TaxID=1404244 RepID=UPI002654F9FC|nr:copper chaperone PCu(A)C [Corynebacterium glyciniphilum]MDN5684605.1 copper chaperone PCu(A)C [Corynebacterium glyciniphilum]MDN6707432.1 copper chaperone PCu(A)C [Corynebacterium glyciniphilum]
MNTLFRRTSATAVAAAFTVGLVACSSDNDSDDTGADTTTSASPEPEGSTSSDDAENPTGALSLGEGYVGAKDAETSMTAVFGELTNSTDEDIHLTRVTGDLDGVYQYHETVDGIMRETDDGLVIPANGSVAMEPGGTHIMIMENNDEIAAGDALTLTLTDEDGNDYELADIPVRVQQSAHEDYGTEGMDGMNDMGEMEGMDQMGSDDSEHAGH